MKVKIKRGEQEMEVEESEVQDGDERISQTQDSNNEEKRFTQSDLNRLLADERRKLQKKHDDLQKQFDDFRTEVDTERSKGEQALKTKLEEMKKGLSPIILNAVNRMTVQDAVEYLSDPENRVSSKTTPRTPQGKEDDGGTPKQKPLGTIF